VSAAVAINEGAGWSTIVLTEGAVASVAFWWLNRTERSVVLDWATTAAVVVLAIGIGATTRVPAPVALAGFAVAAEVAGRSRRATSWAVVAGLAPLGALVASVLVVAPGVLVRLGLTSTPPRLAAIGVGAATALVLGREARRRQSLLLVVLAALAAATGLVDGWTSFVHTPLAHLVGATALFAALEAVAVAVADDEFWGRPARIGAAIAEVLAAIALVVAGVVVLHGRSQHWNAAAAVGSHGAILLAGALGLIGWFLADLGRRETDHTPMGIALLVGSGWAPATVAMAATVMVTVAAGVANPIALGVAAVFVAALLVVGGRPGADVMALVLTIPAPLAAVHHPLVAAALALAGGVVLAAVAVIRAPLRRNDADDQAVWLLAAATLLPAISAWIAAGPTNLLPAVITVVLIAWTCGLVLEGAEDGGHLKGISLVPRGAALLTLVAVPALTPAGAAALTGLLAGLALLDVIAWRRRFMALQTAVLAPVAMAAGLLALGADRAETALAVAALAGVATAVDVLVPREWTSVGRVVVASAAITALVVGGADRPTLATLFIVLGVIALVWAARFQVVELAGLGVLGITGGTWLHLVEHGVRSSEPYVAPVAAALLAAGVLSRRRGPISSWIAYGPPIALMGGGALVGRIGGGGAGHALVAGGVGLVAVIVGGQRRQIAPLLLGTGLLVALTIHETLTVTAGVPTWGWLGLGGSVLIGAGVIMERADRGPIESGRRLVDVIEERFT
jgi:hypothetical protein